MTEQEFNTWLEGHREQLEAIYLTYKLSDTAGRGGHYAMLALNLVPNRQLIPLSGRVYYGKLAIEKFNGS